MVSLLMNLSIGRYKKTKKNNKTFLDFKNLKHVSLTIEYQTEYIQNKYWLWSM